MMKKGWSDSFAKLNICAKNSSTNTLLIGDSIIAGLSRYPKVWKYYFFKQRSLNCGIGGDGSLNVLWRAERMFLPPTLANIIIHCGTNDLDRHVPPKIASNIISIAKVFRKRSPAAKIVIVGLLPRDKYFTSRRKAICEVN